MGADCRSAYESDSAKPARSITAAAEPAFVTGTAANWKRSLKAVRADEIFDRAG
jgi:hypothetical protein